MMNYSKQKGLSSVEMVLVLPMFLFFFVLMANVGKFWHAKLDNQINARTEAWREAMFDSLPDNMCETLEERVEDLRENEQLSQLLRQKQLRDATNFTLSPAGNALACKGNLKNGADYRRTTVLDTTQADSRLNGKSRGYRSGFVGEFNKTSDQPHAITGRAYYLWADWKFKDKQVLLLEDYHVLDVNGSYQRVDLPMGHDDYLERFLIRR